MLSCGYASVMNSANEVILIDRRKLICSDSKTVPGRSPTPVIARTLNKAVLTAVIPFVSSLRRCFLASLCVQLFPEFVPELKACFWQWTSVVCRLSCQDQFIVTEGFRCLLPFLHL
jgi:hypothetical protein